MKYLKHIELHTDKELRIAIDEAVTHCSVHGLDFYKILHGIDAYMHRRKRRDQNSDAADHQAALADLSDPWGNS